jgi:hypothetical protein
MGSLLQSSVFVHTFLLAMLLAWLAGSIAMAVSDARETRRQGGQTVREATPSALAPAERGHPDATRR